MIEQTHDDWKRAIEAVAIEYFLAEPGLPPGMSLAVWENEPEHLETALDSSRIAKALGIHLRHRLPWFFHIPKGLSEEWASCEVEKKVGKEFASARLEPVVKILDDIELGGTWTASYGADHMRARGGVKVTGHPTRASAIMHLERLLGSRQGALEGTSR